ncbi:MAG: heat shock protein transcriptional repressor HspR [Thermoleophilaceae bacterium]
MEATVRSPDDHPRYSISVAAELAGMHPQTLRAYEAKGLVRPRRTPGGTRRYSDRDVERLRKIGTLTGELGMNLAGATRVLDLEDAMELLNREVAALRSQLAAASDELRSELARVHRSYRRDLVQYQPSKPPVLWTFRN